MLRSSLFSLSVVVLAFAGCVGGEAGSASTSTTSGGMGPADFDDSTGGIQGRVLSDELMPIPNALVGLRGNVVIDGEDKLVEQSVTSDAAGTYSLSRIPPGTYTILANALGYQATAAKITVEAGAVVSKDIHLETVAVEGPYELMYIVKGRMAYGAGWKLTPQCIYEPLTTVNPLLKTCGGIRSPDSSNAEIGLASLKTPSGAGDLAPDWATILIELTWTQQTPVFGRSLQLDVLFANISRGTGGAVNQQDPRYFQNQDYSSPVVLRIDRPTLDERKIPMDDQYGNVRARVFTANADLGTWPTGPDVGVMLEQSFTYHISIGFVDPLPAEFSALPDR